MENWLVTDDGTCTNFGTAETEPPKRTYRMYRFLTEMEDILERESDDAKRVRAIIPLVRKLLISSYWLQMEHKAPSEKTGVGSKLSLPRARVSTHGANGDVGSGDKINHPQSCYLGNRGDSRRAREKYVLETERIGPERDFSSRRTDALSRRHYWLH